MARAGSISACPVANRSGGCLGTGITPAEEVRDSSEGDAEGPSQAPGGGQPYGWGSLVLQAGDAAQGHARSSRQGHDLQSRRQSMRTQPHRKRHSWLLSQTGQAKGRPVVARQGAGRVDFTVALQTTDTPPARPTRNKIMDKLPRQTQPPGDRGDGKSPGMECFDSLSYLRPAMHAHVAKLSSPAAGARAEAHALPGGKGVCSGSAGSRTRTGSPA